jgi:hypothetical protein
MSEESTLSALPDELSEAPISKLLAQLLKAFPDTPWATYEPETLAMHWGLHFTPLFLHKVELLRGLVLRPEVLEDAMFLLHAADVANDIEADFSHMPAPTTLELAFFVDELKKCHELLGRTFEPSAALSALCKYFLREEGYSVVPDVFSFVDKAALYAGQTPQDSANKIKAIEAYVKAMQNGHR